MSLELYKISLGQLKGIGPSRATRILRKLSSLSDLFTQTDRELHLQTGVSLSILKEMNRGEALLTAEKQQSYNERNQITSHFFMDEDYPRRLRQCPDAPIVLFSKGLTDLNHSNVVSLGLVLYTYFSPFLIISGVISFTLNLIEGFFNCFKLTGK